jgi:hypothetical protein
VFAEKKNSTSWTCIVLYSQKYTKTAHFRPFLGQNRSKLTKNHLKNTYITTYPRLSAPFSAPPQKAAIHQERKKKKKNISSLMFKPLIRSKIAQNTPFFDRF